MDPLKVIFAPIQPFVWHPERIAVIAVIFFLGYVVFRSSRRVHATWFLAAALGWAAFALWEWYCKAMRYNIRIDLFLIYPVLFIVTLWCIIAAFRRHRM
jgi:hypothetical protein